MKSGESGGRDGHSGASREGARLQPRVGVAGDVIHLADYRRGKLAVWALAGLLHSPDWLRKIYLEADADGVRVIALVRDDSTMVRSVFPSSIDDIPVVIRKAGMTTQRRT